MSLLDMEDCFWLLLPGVIGHVIFCLSASQWEVKALPFKSCHVVCRSKVCCDVAEKFS